MSEMIEKARGLAKKHQEGLYKHLEAVFQKMVDAGIKDEKVLASAFLHHLPGQLDGVDEEVAKIVELYHNLEQKEIKKSRPRILTRTI